MTCIFSGSAQAAAAARATAAPRRGVIVAAWSSSPISRRARSSSNGSGNRIAGSRASSSSSSSSALGDGARAAIVDGNAASAHAAVAAASVAGSSRRPRKNNQAVEFRTLASEGNNLIPLYRRIFDDQLTPILAYRCLVKEDERDAPSFLLESVVGGTQTGRFSFLGSRPYMEARITRHDATQARTTLPPSVTHISPPQNLPYHTTSLSSPH